MDSGAEKFLSDAANHLVAPAVTHGEEKGDEPIGSKPPWGTVFLDQANVHSLSGRGKGGRAPGGTAAADQDIALFNHRDTAARLFDLSFFHWMVVPPFPAPPEPAFLRFISEEIMGIKSTARITSHIAQQNPDWKKMARLPREMLVAMM